MECDSSVPHLFRLTRRTDHGSLGRTAAMSGEQPLCRSANTSWAERHQAPRRPRHRSENFEQKKLCGVCEQERVAIDAELRSYLRQAFAKLELADGHTSVLSVAPFCLAY